MQATPHRTALCLALAVAGCAASTPDATLDAAVETYNESLRWKRFDNAAAFLPAADQAEFLQRYTEAEDDLHIDAIEVRGARFDPNHEPPAATVTVVASAYRLPSTILRKVVITQRWELGAAGWTLLGSDPELLPAKAPDLLHADD